MATALTDPPAVTTADANAAIVAALPHCSDALLAALRMRLAHAEQLRRLGVVPTGKPATNVSTTGR